jgi:uroporphyrinogen-III synthase
VTGPLAGRVVVVTRPAEAARPLARRLVGLGAEVLAAPTIEIRLPPPGGPLDAAIESAAAGRFRWVVFTSATGVRAWRQRSAALGAGPPRARIAAVGDATADALRAGGAEPDLVPDSFTTAALGAAFPAGRGEVLLARADLATPALEEIVASKGWTPVGIDAYAVAILDELPADAREAVEAGRVDAVMFTSPSTVDGFVRAGGGRRHIRAICIGPVTAEAARAAGFTVAAVAEPHTMDGLVDAVLRALH